jgi:predicted acetyltransferase
MAIQIKIPTAAQWPDMVRADGRGFGFVPTQEDIDTARPTVDLDRFRIATDAGQIIAVAGSFALDITVPGGASIPASGITWVSVSATHRRQGLLTRLMAALHDDADARGEPVAVLGASEGGIYERFGYGIAAQLRYVAINRAEATLRPELRPDPTAVRFADGEAAFDHLVPLFERFRRTRAGEISRNAAFHRRIADRRAKPVDGQSAAFHLIHRDGYVAYRYEDISAGGAPRGRLELLDFLAVTPQAHLDLWHTVLGVDLVTEIVAFQLSVDEPLPYLLTNSRAYRTTRMTDGLWANVRDPAIAFGARTYGTADRVVVEVDEQRWAIESDGTEASCRKVRSKPDLVMDHPSLGALLFGGVRPSVLARGRRLTARSDVALGRADAFFVTGPAPGYSTWF